LHLRNLPIKVTGREALTEKLHALHPSPGSGLLANHEGVGFDAASAVISS
jgi:hypothetical protein